MKKTIGPIIICCLVAFMMVNSPADSNETIAKKILAVYPQADTNGDGVLSREEQATVHQAVMSRYPNADSDGDGTLSISEQEALLEKALEAKYQNFSAELSKPSPNTSPLANADAASTESVSIGSPIRQGPRPVKPGALGVGRQIADLAFMDVDGEEYRLSDFANQNAIVVAMTGTGCPLCLKYTPSLAAIERRYQEQGVAFLFVNPSESEKRERLQNAIKQHGFQGPYVHDIEKALPSLLGAKTTTEVFILDRARTLVYRGAVDDQYGFAYALEAPRSNFLTDALDAVLTGKTPRIQATTAPGCELFANAISRSNPPITYHNRVSRIIQSNCIDCHRTGGIAPIPLETYVEVKDYANMIRNVVQQEIMPPWFAAPQPNNDKESHTSLHWANDRSLSDREKNDLFAWVEAGAPEGDPTDAPLPKTFPDGWMIGKPDVTFGFSEPIRVKPTGIMPYQYVTVETNLPEDKWIQAIEIRPGKIDVVHHVIVTIQSERSKRNGGPDRKRNSERSRGQGRGNDALWAGYAPGNSTWVYPDGYARLLPKGATLRFQMHYTPNGTATEDSTQIGLVYADERPRHEVRVAAVANTSIRIPPYADNHREVAELQLPYDVQVLSFLPHMHLRGKEARFQVLTADRTETLLHVPRYDFNWQLQYRLNAPLPLKRGDTLQFTGWFDNSSSNPANPAPSQTVAWGQQTEDEMLIGYVEYVVPGARPGDPIAALKSRMPNSRRNAVTQNRGTRPNMAGGEIHIGGQRIRVGSLVKTLRELDKNGDEKLAKSEVPQKHRALFELLDANHDGIVTADEVKSTINNRQP